MNAWKCLDEAHRFWIALGAIIAASVLAGATLTQYSTIPSRVDDIEAKVEVMQDNQKEVLTAIGRANCKLDMILEGTPERRCP